MKKYTSPTVEGRLNPGTYRRANVNPIYKDKISKRSHFSAFLVFLPGPVIGRPNLNISYILKDVFYAG